MGNNLENKQIPFQQVFPLSTRYNDDLKAFLDDCMIIMKYCNASLQNEDAHKITELNKKLILENNKQDYDKQLFQYLLEARKKILDKFFEGVFLEKKFLKYTIKDYNKLVDFLDSEKENSFLDIFSLSKKIENGHSQPTLKSNDLEFQNLFQSIFFRSNLIEKINLVGFNQKQTQGLSQYFINPQPYKSENDKFIKDDEIILKITQEEFRIISRVFYKYYYKIQNIQTIPQDSTLNNLFWNSKHLLELNIIAELNSNQVDQVAQTLFDNIYLEKLQLYFKEKPTSRQIDILYFHPQLKYLSLGFKETPSVSLKKLKSLREIFVDSDQISKYPNLVESEKIILKFEANQFQFTQMSFQLLCQFKQTFIIIKDSFRSFALSAFGQLDVASQVKAAQTLLDFLNNNIIIDACIQFIDQDDYLKFESRNYSFQNQFYLFITKMVVDFEREIICQQMKIQIINSIMRQKGTKISKIITDLEQDEK